MQVNRIDSHLQKRKQRQILGLAILIILLLGLFGIFANYVWTAGSSQLDVHSAQNHLITNEYSSIFVQVSENGSFENQLIVENTPTPTETKSLIPTETVGANETAVLASNRSADEDILPTATETMTTTPTETAVLIEATSTSTPDILIITAVADAFVSSQRTSDNFGRLSTLDMGANPISNAYLRFDIPTLHTTLSEVVLRVRLDESSADTVSLFFINDNEWDEYAISYDNAPEMDSFHLLADGGRSKSWVELDVTELVTQTGLISFGLQTLNDSPFEFLSRESDYAPELLLVFGDPTPAMPTETATAFPTETVEPTPTVATPTETPTPNNPVAPTATPTDMPVIIPPPPIDTPVPQIETLTFTAVADAFIHALQPNVNYGTLNYMSLDSSPTKNGLILFNIDDFEGTVDRAFLRIYSHDELDDGIRLYDVEDNNWLETEVTYANAPAFGSFIGEIESVQLNSWVEIDLSTAVIESGFVSIGLSSPTLGSLELSTRETSRAPELILQVIDHNPAPPAPEPPPPEPPSHCLELPGNVITNGNFSSGLSEWDYYSDGKATLEAVVADPEYCEEVAQFTITQEGSNVQIYQSGITLNANTSYTLRFAAKSTNGNDMSLHLQKHEPNYQHYGLNGVVVDLTPEWQLFEIVFTTENFTGQVQNGRLRFWFAPYDEVGEVYWIDHVELIEN
ncbi:MAG: DNRLRE domain-containing protein [Chloroflexota bacterium]